MRSEVSLPSLMGSNQAAAAHWQARWDSTETPSSGSHPRGPRPCCMLSAMHACVQDREVAKAFQRALTKQGLKWKLGHKCNKAEREGDIV